MKQEVLYKKDVLEEVAKRLGLTYQEAEYNYKGLVHVMQEMMQDPKVATIIIPKIGKMYVRAGQLTHMRRAYQEKDITPSTRVKKLFEKLENMENNPDMRRKSYYKRNKLNNFFFTNGLSRKEMEEQQNKRYNEHKKRYNNS